MNGLLKTLIKPDWDDNPKRSEILHAANLLQIGEFQLIQLAYKVWYKENLLEDKINKIFSEYMIQTRDHKRDILHYNYLVHLLDLILEYLLHNMLPKWVLFR